MSDGAKAAWDEFQAEERKTKKKRKMTIESYIEITDWCRENKYKIHEQEWPKTKACKEASKALGYDVPLTTMIRCSKVAEIKWPKSRPTPVVPIDREAILVLMGALAGLYVETGKTVPDNLANLQSAYIREKQKATSEGRAFGYEEELRNFEGKG